MGYPNFGKVKTLVLPYVQEAEDPITIERYKELTGIDLHEFLSIVPTEGEYTIKFNAPGTLILLNLENATAFRFAGILAPNAMISAPYIAGDNEGKFELQFFDADANFGVAFSVRLSETGDPTMENIRISTYSL